MEFLGVMTSEVYGGASNRKYQLAREGGLTLGEDDRARARSRVEIRRSSR
jgi:hypothetical protein